MRISDWSSDVCSSDLPEGTAARPKLPSSSSTSTSTVGLPRLSRISRPWMSMMAVMAYVLLGAPNGAGRERRPPVIDAFPLAQLLHRNFARLWNHWPRLAIYQCRTKGDVRQGGAR